MFKSTAVVEEESDRTDDECSIEKVGQREEEEGVKEQLKVEEDSQENTCNESFSSEALRYVCARVVRSLSSAICLLNIHLSPSQQRRVCRPTRVLQR